LRPRRKVLVAKKEAAPAAKSAPLALVPEAAIAALENDAANQANVEIDTTTTASIPNVAQVQTGYAAQSNDPRPMPFCQVRQILTLLSRQSRHS